MAHRRELLLLIVAACLLLGPGQALAAPQWLEAEQQPGDLIAAAPDVAADGDGNSVAVWVNGTQVVAAYRPRGGGWASPVNLEPGGYPQVSDARVTVLPNGEFVAAWIADRNNDGDVILRSATRSAAGDWTAETIRESCCEGIEAFDAGGDGSVTVVGREGGGPFSNTRPPGSTVWGPRLQVPTTSGSQYAFGPDGSVLTAFASNCGSAALVPCVRAAYLGPGGAAWGAPETVAAATGGSGITGVGVTATPDGASTIIWGEAVPVSAAPPAAPGRVRSADREPGTGGTWATPLIVADLPDDVPGCSGNGDCFDVASGPDGTEVAMWQQSGTSGDQMSAALRPPGGGWGGVENAGAPGSNAARPLAAITTTGVPVAAWGEPASGASAARGTHRDLDGAWSQVTLSTPPQGLEGTVFLSDIAADGDGNALTAWRDPSGVFTSGFDGAGPRFTAFSLPSGSLVDAPFSAAADDDWSQPASIAWTFGDGTGAPGASVTHAYGAPGTFTATATATDTIGNAAGVSGTVAVIAEPTPTPDPCGTTDKDKDGIKDGCDTNDGSKRPVAFKTVNATVVSGEVFVKLPAGAARASQTKPPKGFVRLVGAQTIPVRSTLDTSKGRVRLRTASDTRKHVQTAEFFRGRFLIRQVRKPRGKAKKRSTKLITELRLSGSSFSKACKAKASIAAKKRSKKRVRRLFGDGKGSFRTRGRNAAATVRGTRWGVQDRCDGTLVTVQRGRVEVRDLVRHKTVIVRTGHTYLARRR